MAALHQSQARNVRPTTIRIIGKQTPQKTIEQTRLPTKQIGTWPLETQHTANTIHIGRGRLWGEIRWLGTHPASQKHTQGTLQTHMRLDRNTMHRDHIGLGLQKKRCIC